MGSQLGQRMGALEIRHGIQPAKLGSSTDPQATAQWRGDKMPFSEDDLSGQRNAWRCEGGVVAALAFQQNLVADAPGQLRGPRTGRHHNGIGLQLLAIAEFYR